MIDQFMVTMHCILSATNTCDIQLPAPLMEPALRLNSICISIAAPKNDNTKAACKINTDKGTIHVVAGPHHEGEDFLVYVLVDVA